MIQARKCAGLPLEPLPSLFPFQEISRQYLYRNLSREFRVLRPVNLSHSASAEGRENLVAAETRAGGQHSRDESTQELTAGRDWVLVSEQARRRNPDASVKEIDRAERPVDLTNAVRPPY